MKVTVLSSEDSVSELRCQLNSKVSSSWIGSTSGYVISAEGSLYESKIENSSLTLTPLLSGVGIRSLSAIPSAALFLSFTGQVYAFGSDTTQEGILGIPGIYNLDSPTLIPSLQPVHASHISLAVSHGCLIDVRGDLYTWGSGEVAADEYKSHQLPVKVPQDFQAKSLTCNETCICVCSNGGFIHVYGAIGTAHMSCRGGRVSLLSQFISTEVSLGNGFLVFLTEDKEVYAVDDCMEAIKLPSLTKTLFSSISVNGEFVFGLTTDNFIYSWSECQESNNNALCALSHWGSKVYEVNHHGNPIGYVGASEIGLNLWGNLQVQLSTSIKPYQVSETAQKIIGAVQELESRTPLLSKASSSLTGSPRKSHDDLNRLYPNEGFEHTIETIIRCRIEYEHRITLLNAFRPILYPNLEFTLRNINQYALDRWKNRRISAAATIKSYIVTVYEKEKIAAYLYGFNKLKNFMIVRMRNDIKKQESAKLLAKIEGNIKHRSLLECFYRMKELKRLYMERMNSLNYVSTKCFYPRLKAVFDKWKINTNIYNKKKKGILLLQNALKKNVHKKLRKIPKIIEDLKKKEMAIKTIVNPFNKFLLSKTLKQSFDAIRQRSEKIKTSRTLGSYSIFNTLHALTNKRYSFAFEKLSIDQYMKWKLGLNLLFASLRKPTDRWQAFKYIKNAKNFKKKNTQTELLKLICFDNLRDFTQNYPPEDDPYNVCRIAAKKALKRSKKKDKGDSTTSVLTNPMLRSKLNFSPFGISFSPFGITPIKSRPDLREQKKPWIPTSINSNFEKPKLHRNSPGRRIKYDNILKKRIKKHRSLKSDASNVLSSAKHSINKIRKKQTSSIGFYQHSPYSKTPSVIDKSN